MVKIASLVVDNASRQVNNLFDYIIPENLNDIIKIGMRVVIPFGKGNKNIEGIIVNIKDSSEFDNLKEIVDIADSIQYVDEEMIKLAHFLSDEYNCSLYEAFKTILPSGINLKENIYIKLNAAFKSTSDVTASYKKIIGNLDYNKYMDFNEIKKNINNISRSTIFNMEKDGILSIVKEMKQQVNIKLRNVYKIKDKNKALSFLNNHEKKYNRQAEILNKILDLNKPMTLTDLTKEFKCSKSVVDGLLDKGLIEKIQEEVYRDSVHQEYNYDRVELNNEQINAIDSIMNSVNSNKNITLIRGITGCGKTEIYLSVVEKLIQLGYGAIVLVPEISLTPQTLERFRGRFGKCVAILHSKMSDGERYDEWRRIKNGDVNVVVGARSAVFAPVNNLKAIILDEEHEYSYKSDMTPKYLTHDVAAFRVKLNNGVLVLGSATPSIESYYNAVSGKYNLIEILNRVDNKKLPDVKIIDMREELQSGNRSVFSKELYENIKENIKNEEQTILFLNRRGYSTFVSCRACGYVCKCDRCDVTMTYHEKASKLICHYCGREIYIPNKCPSCGSKYIKYFGTGTEKIESEIKKFFPYGKVVRMDMDTTRRKGEHERLYRVFKNHEADILIGTQMVSKGMDFKDVTLVGVIAADTSLNLPDFRAGERTFQLLTQVAGRAGRGDKKGRVIIQTYEPEHYSIKCSQAHDYMGFYNREIKIRKELNNPPFSDILFVLLYSTSEDELIKKSMDIKNIIIRKVTKDDVEVLGPVPCCISKIKNYYRWQFILKGNAKVYFKTIDKELFNLLKSSSVRYSIDINPYNML